METPPYLHSALPVRPWEDALARRLPGLQPADVSRWLVRDEMFGAQMALREKLLNERCAEVYAPAEGDAAEAAHILLSTILDLLRRDPAYSISPDGRVIRPDGARIDTRAQPPLLAAARLVQEDLLLLLPGATEHIFAAGVLCFPASWTLGEKTGRPMTAIHTPVRRYDAGIAARVQRMISNLRPLEPVWRANAFRYNAPELFHPRPENDPRRFDEAGPCFVRVEYQSLMRLPRTEAVVFSIHTYMAPATALKPEEMKAMLEWLAAQ